MIIAVTYDNGNVFQHFGRTEQFKLYEAEDGKILSSEIIGTGGSGHEALAGVLADRGVDVLICGGLGGGAQMALDDEGITVIAGASGSADEAVEAYLKGELTDAGVTCDHHHHGDEEGCAPEDCASCGHGCGGPMRPVMEGKNVGKVCRVHYRGTFNDGTQFDSSYDRGEPLEFTCGVGMMIRGFDAAVAEMEVGETVDIHLLPSEAYGERNPGAVLKIPVDQLPGAADLAVGSRVFLTNGTGRPVPVLVTAKDDTLITFDANHEMAGKELNFRIELLSCE